MGEKYGRDSRENLANYRNDGEVAKTKPILVGQRHRLRTFKAGAVSSALVVAESRNPMSEEKRDGAIGEESRDKDLAPVLEISASFLGALHVGRAGKTI